MAYRIKARLQSPPVGRGDGAGVDHNMFVDILDVEDIPVMHLPCIIPIADFETLLEPMNNAARVALYKSLIIEYYGNTAVPYDFPTEPVAPTPPSSLDDLQAIADYFDAKKIYNVEHPAWQTTVSALQADLLDTSSSLATTATNWIENLSAFDGWPFDFILQAAS